MAGAVIFDIDGTLLDSVDLHAAAWQEAFKHFGYEFEFAQVRQQIGKGGDQLLPVFLNEEERARIGKNLQEYRAKLFKDKYLSQVKPFPGVRKLFEAVLRDGQKVALASSARGDELKNYERIADIEDLVQVETSSADAELSKPHPDIFESALDRLGSEVQNDAEAAKNAGLRSIGVLCGGFPEEMLRGAGCMAIYRGPADLLEHYDESPLSRREAAATP